MEGTGPSTTGRREAGCGAAVPAGTGLKTAVGAMLLGRCIPRTRNAELRWPTRPSSIICFCSAVSLIAAIVAAASTISGVIAGQPRRSDCAGD